MKIEVFIKKERDDSHFEGYLKCERESPSYAGYDFLYDNFIIESDFIKPSRLDSISEYILFKAVESILRTGFFYISVKEFKSGGVKIVKFTGWLDDDVPAGGGEEYCGRENIERYIYEARSLRSTIDIK